MGNTSSESTRLLANNAAGPSGQRTANGNKAVRIGVIFGRTEKTLSCRTMEYNSPIAIPLPKDMHMEGYWKDATFQSMIERDRINVRGTLSWDRPKEYAKDVKLRDRKTNRFSVKQGEVGDCFFLSTLSAIAENPEYLVQILPANAYETSESKYKGVFHCRLWWLGEWFDIYTDDRLPYNKDIRGTVFGAHSDKHNVVWVSLMEKALARLCGSYSSVGGDQAAAYVLLTGGVVEELKFQGQSGGQPGGQSGGHSGGQGINENPLSPEATFSRVRKALKARSAVLTGIEEQQARRPYLRGLVWNHAYSVTGAKKILYNNEKIMLLRIRNPWGETNKVRPQNENGEWKGRWSYESEEWKQVNRRVAKKYNVQYEHGGEFWVCMEDFCKIFGHLYIADAIPNIDEDGFRKKDKMSHVINILSEWSVASGNELNVRFKNPRFVLTVAKHDPAGHKIPVYLQLIQQYENVLSQKSEKVQSLYCRIDLFRIEKKKVVEGGRIFMSLTEMTNPDPYVGNRTVAYQYKLKPGKYLLVPNFLSSKTRLTSNRPICMRIFSSVELKCREMKDYPAAMTGGLCRAFGDKADSSNKICRINIFGQWKVESPSIPGSSSGSDDVRRMKNSKYILTVRGFGSRKVSIQLRHVADLDMKLHCRVDVFKINADVKRNKQRWMLLHEITIDKTFIGGEISHEYDLAPGQYLLIPNVSRTQQATSAFCLRILSSSGINCRSMKNESPVTFVRTAESVHTHQGQRHELEQIKYKFGEWLTNQTAGGQISNNNTFHTNPQYGLTVSGSTSQLVLIDLLQETIEPVYAIGCHIVKVERGQNLPLDKDKLLHNQRIQTASAGGSHTFIRSCESRDYYLLEPGKYDIMVFADRPTDLKKYALLIAAEKQANISLTDSRHNTNVSG